MDFNLISHHKNINDIDFCHQVKKEITNVLHKIHPAMQQTILNSVTCKNHPEILERVMLSMINDGRINSIEILKNNGFDINQPIFCPYQYRTFNDLLHYALDIIKNNNESSAFKLIELGCYIKDSSHISLAIKKKEISLKLVAALLEKRPDYIASDSDYMNLVKMYSNNESKYFRNLNDSNEHDASNKKAIHLIKLLYNNKRYYHQWEF